MLQHSVLLWHAGKWSQAIKSDHTRWHWVKLESKFFWQSDFISKSARALLSYTFGYWIHCVAPSPRDRRCSDLSATHQTDGSVMLCFVQPVELLLSYEVWWLVTFNLQQHHQNVSVRGTRQKQTGRWVLLVQTASHCRFWLCQSNYWNHGVYITAYMWPYSHVQ